MVDSDDPVAELRSRAAALGMSVSAYLLSEQADGGPKPPIAETLRKAAKDGRREDVTTDEIVDIIRLGRESR
ncbi:hypothetical protein [Nocardioides marmorisolisilvae]|uniref:Uncharacterized protein n=1 Tax=Nocardioides marmorisolisilvae TaxID=1542737 RepID=A0A3N0DSQ5_9ACTN|nr:hypothetical protein [Nocardioides marmorisolisilvae]RNL78506.1 hypothetical protein EFL95_05265 [Nocardioides marmorisolisilvae]